MTIDEARQLFAYNSWANGLIFAAAAALSEDEFGSAVASSFPSVGATLAHVVGAEWIWLRRWLGESPAAPPWVANRNLAELKTQLARVEAERSSLLAGANESDLDRVVSYRTLSGKAYSDPLGALIRHIVNHSTYHRGQIATQLRQLGHTPPNTDLITYLRLWK